MQRSVKALRCEPEELGALLPVDHNALVGAAMRRFGAHLGRMRAQSAAQPELPPAQRYVLSELRKIHGELWAPEEFREKAERLEEAFRFEASSAVKRELRGLHRARPTGEDLVGALEELYAKYRLGEERRESEERRRKTEAEGTPRVVCSEAAL